MIKKTVLKRAALVFLISLYTSCTNGDFSELLRSYDDPSDDTPNAACYREPCTVRLSWNEDECADRFILMRAEDDGAENFVQVYSGKDTTFTDRFYQTDDQKRYVYRLDKTRGSKRFKGSVSTCAVVSMTLHDTHEPNDNIENAVELERIITATMPCSQFNYSGRCFSDEDWYYIRLKPQCIASILFCQSGKGSTVSDSDFMYMEYGGEIKSLQHNEKFTVTNSSFTTKNIYFKILPDIAKIFAGTQGAEVPSYTITLTEEDFK